MAPIYGGPGAPASATGAGIDYSEQQFDTQSHRPQQSLSPERRLAVSQALRRFERQPTCDNVRRLIRAIQGHNGGRRTWKSVFLSPLARHVPPHEGWR